MPAPEKPRRNVINCPLFGRVYQRGQMLSWTLEQKLRVVADLQLAVVVNLWPKLDPDWGNTGVIYWQVPTPRSIAVVEDTRYRLLAATVARLGPVLVLCEAGKTRSACFVGLVLEAMGDSRANALGRLRATIPGLGLKPEMLRYFETGPPTIERDDELLRREVRTAVQLQQKLGVMPCPSS